MSNVKKSLNELFVNIFNYILSIEGAVLKKQNIDLSMNEIHVIEAIDNTPTPTMSNVANRLLITPGTLSISINRLSHKGYVKRTIDANDRRKILLSLTSKGRLMKKVHDEFHDDMIDFVIQDMKITEDSQLMVALDHLQTYFLNKYQSLLEEKTLIEKQEE